MRTIPTKTTSRRTAWRAGEEAGSVLVLVLIFMIVGGMTVGALLTSVSNDLKNTAHFTSARSLQYDTLSATNLAIQSIRYAPLLSAGQTLNASPPSPCWATGAGAPSALPSIDATGNPIDNGNTVDVWCSTHWTPTSAATRVVTLSACPSSVSSAAACALNPTLQAVVTFDDYPVGLSTPSSAQCVVYCGTAMTVNSWVQSQTQGQILPTVGGINNGSGPLTGAAGLTTGGTLLTISGSGFVVGTTANPGSTVSFVEESANVPASGNVVLPATVVAVTPTLITALSPSITAGTLYFVTVTTPSGTSATGPTAIFTYSGVVPTVGSLSPTSGLAVGGSSLTISGTGFVSGATVNFVSGSLVFPATNVVVVNNTSITAVSPAVTAIGSYGITVTTPTGASASTGLTFTYSATVPSAASINPTSGSTAGGTSVTITGTGFVTGATVSFVPESGSNVSGAGVSGVGVTVTGPTSITVYSPALTAGTYYVTVTTPAGISSYYPVFAAS